MDLNQKLKEYTFVAFDTETSGAYPIGYDVVEFGAIKWHQGMEIGRLQFLFKPREPMSDFIIGIHGITNEMVANSPDMSEKVQEIYEFLKDTIIMAHHAPFDMGFMAVEFEKNRLQLLPNPVLCTSLMSRQLIYETENHKLQTLVKYFNWDGGAAHRAFDDAKACLQVGFECFRRMGENATLAEIIRRQGKNLEWKNFSLLQSNQPIIKTLVEAIQQKKRVDIAYDGGSQKGETRQVNPIGIVRNPDGDYLMAFCLRDKVNKRYYLVRIKDAAIIY